MKIAVVGVARSRTTVLLEKLKILHPNFNCLYEYYTYGLKKNNSILDLSKSLATKNNFIVKILSHNSFAPCTIQDFCLDKYDELFLIERLDFFNQCCSLEFSQTTNIWHRRNLSQEHEKFLMKPFVLKKETILFQARGVEKYLEIKKYIIDHNMNYFLHDYDDFKTVPKRIIQENNLDYSTMFENYYLKDEIEKLFSNYFCYKTCKYDYTAFCENLNRII